MNKTVIIFLTLGILIILGIGIYFAFFNEKPTIKDFPLNNTICTPTYLGFCYNQSNSAYGCNIETKTCDDMEFKLVTMIGFMQEQNIKIYGTTWCPACKKQLNEFGKYGGYLIENKIFIYCDVEPVDFGCSDVKSVPTWKQDGQIVHIGTLSIQQIISSTGNTS